MKKLNVPILLIIYNRASTTAQVIDSLARVKPTKIYCIGDGARSELDQDQVRAARTQLNRITWNCAVKTRFFQKNRGLKKTVEAGLDWVFANEESVIVLEDDILADPTFFEFAASMLTKYKNVASIAGVCGYNPVISKINTKKYRLSRYHRSWGWATWKRSWHNYNLPLESKTNQPYWRTLYTRLGSLALSTYLALIKYLVERGRIDTWDYHWSLINLELSHHFVIPPSNLVTNIGIGAGATHTRIIPSYLRPSIKPYNPPYLTTKNPLMSQVEDNEFANLAYLNYRAILGALRKLLWQ